MPSTKRKRLVLVDGMSQIYRAYYALPDLSNSKGLPTNAVYGFTMMLRRIINEYKPDYLGVALESKEPTFRHAAFEQYKATRQAMPDDLGPQLPYIERVCEVLRVPTIRYQSYEADDVIGTLARQAEAQKLDVLIVTNDKDMSQLVTDCVRLLRTDRTGEIKMMDAAAVEAKLGVRPDQVIELLGLWGDTIDNIPGAPGIGEKGAKQIIHDYGTIENAIARADEIPRKTYRESLKNNVDLIMKSRELVTIACDVPVELNLDSLVYEQADSVAAYQLFSELEFNNLRREYADAAADGAEGVVVRQAREINYASVITPGDLDRLIESLMKSDAFALSVAERKGSVYGIAFSTKPGVAWLVDFERFEGKVKPLDRLKSLLENPKLRKSIHDWKGALTLLDSYAAQQSEDDQAPLLKIASGRSGEFQEYQIAAGINGVEEDTLLASYLLDPNRAAFRVSDMAREHLEADWQDRTADFDEDSSRALQSADFTLQLGGVLKDKIKSADLEKVYRDIELPLVEILFEMERLGVRIDTNALKKAGQEIENELGRLTAEIYGLAGEEFNINSPTQLGDIFEKLNFEIGRKTKTGRISTSVDVLEDLASRYELPRRVIDYRELSKLKSTYVDSLPKLIDPRSGRVHTTLNQAVSATGRLSSTNPNLQNIPIRSEMGRRIRAAFVASPDHLLMSADYSQIELRLFAHITGDKAMTDAFARGEDIHARTARDVFGAKTKEEESEARRLAKIVNFAIPYVIGPFGLAQRTGLSRAEAKKVIEDYYATYTGVRRYMSETPENVRKTGAVRTIFGRMRPIPDITNRNHALRSRAEREAINAPIQGTAADLVKMAMIKVAERLKKEKLSGRMILQVHDELLLEVPAGEIESTRDLVRHEMESVYRLNVPLVVDTGIGSNWMEAKP
jgi:DNA polymerase-1